MRGRANTQARTHTISPFLEEMSLARSSLRLARESASSRGKAFSWGAERLCCSWDSSTVWMSASRRAARRGREDGFKWRAGGKKQQIRRWRTVLGRFLLASYPQQGPRRSAGRRRGAGWRRRGARGSSCTGRPARRTHTALQSSVVQPGRKEEKLRR